MVAARVGRTRILRHLLRLNGGDDADINTTDVNGTTPIVAAAAGAHHNIVDILLRAGADVDERDDFGWSVVTAACFACARTLTLTDTKHTGRKRVDPFRCLVLLLASRRVGTGTLVHAIMTIRAVRSVSRRREEEEEEEEEEGDGEEEEDEEALVEVEKGEGEKDSRAAKNVEEKGEGKESQREKQRETEAKRHAVMKKRMMLQGMMCALPVLQAEARGDRRWCAFPQCHAVDLQESFDLCSQCMQVGYCSRRCRKSHWRAEVGGHRAVCEEIIGSRDGEEG